MFLAAFEDTSYKVLLFLHIFVVIVGIGGVFLNGVYGMQVRAAGPDGLVILKAVHKVTNVAMKFIYLIPIFGILLVLDSGVGNGEHNWKFSQSWVGLALLLYIAAIAISHAVLKPSVKKMIALGEEMKSNPSPGGPPPQLGQMQELGKRLGIFSMVNQLIVVVILYLMIWKPGV
jgi:hypothetical protein